MPLLSIAVIVSIAWLSVQTSVPHGPNAHQEFQPSGGSRAMPFSSAALPPSSSSSSSVSTGRSSLPIFATTLALSPRSLVAERR